MYVDNVITGTNDVGEAVKAKAMFRNAAMNLREWSTNNETFNKLIPNEDKTKAEVIKVLGRTWNTRQDTLSLKRSSILDYDTPPTKRSVLKKLASVYDPLGLFSPLLLRGKVLPQTIWSKGQEWDENLKQCDAETWFSWQFIKDDLKELPEIDIPRCIALQDDNMKYRLLCFCDASRYAYATCIYLHQQGNSQSRVDLNFVQSRLAPRKKYNDS